MASTSGPQEPSADLVKEFEAIQLISLQSARKMKEAVGTSEALGRKANSA